MALLACSIQIVDHELLRSCVACGLCFFSGFRCVGLGWSIRLVMALTQQVLEPVRNPVRVQIGVYGGSAKCLGIRHVRLGPENPVNLWTKDSSMGARYGPTSEKGQSQELGPSIGTSATCISYKTDDVVDLSRFCPSWGRVCAGIQMVSPS